MGHMPSFPVGLLLKYLSHCYRLKDVKKYYTFLCPYIYDVKRFKLTSALGGCFMDHEFFFVLVAFVDGNNTSSQGQVFLFVSWLNLSNFPQGVAGYPLEQFCGLQSLLSPKGPLLHPLSLNSLLLFCCIES